MNPATTVSGVLSSCETLAMNWRRFDAGYVTRQQQLLLVAIGNDLDRQRHARLALRRHHDGVGEIAGLEVTNNFGLADEVREGPAEVTLGLEP